MALKREDQQVYTGDYKTREYSLPLPLLDETLQQLTNDKALEFAQVSEIL